MTRLAAASALTVSIPREGWQSMRIWEYCPFTVSRYCRRMVSRLIALTNDTSMPDSWMSAGIRSTPSGWCRIPSPGRSCSSVRIRPIASDRVKGSLSGWGLPRLMVRLPCGSPSIRRTFFPACAKPIPRFAQVVVLPTPPFWLAMAMISVFKWNPPFAKISCPSNDEQLCKGMKKAAWRKFQTAEYVLYLYCFRLLELRTATFSISKEISMILAPISKIPHFLSKMPVFPAKN